MLALQTTVRFAMLMCVHETLIKKIGRIEEVFCSGTTNGDMILLKATAASGFDG